MMKSEESSKRLAFYIRVTKKDSDPGIDVERIKLELGVDLEFTPTTNSEEAKVHPRELAKREIVEYMKKLVLEEFYEMSQKEFKGYKIVVDSNLREPMILIHPRDLARIIKKGPL